MHLFNRTYLQGMHDRLVERGAMAPFADDDTATTIFDKVAEAFNFAPLFETRPVKEAVLQIAQTLKTASDNLVAAGRGPSASRLARVKQAAVYDPTERAYAISAHYMEKAASEADGSLTGVGQNTPEGAAAQDQVAALDLRNRAPGQYGVPQGDTDLAMPGVVGREVTASQKTANNLGVWTPGAPTLAPEPEPEPTLRRLRSPQEAEDLKIPEIIHQTAVKHPGLEALWARLKSNPLHDFRNLMPDAAHASQRSGMRMDALKNLGTKGVAALGLAGLGYGGYKGIQALRGGNNEPSPEELAMMQHTASEKTAGPRWDAFKARLMSSPTANLRGVFGRGAEAAQEMAGMGVPDEIARHLSRGARMDSLKNLGVQGGTALGGAGLLAGLGYGGYRALGGGGNEPSPEELAMMQHTASIKQAAGEPGFLSRMGGHLSGAAQTVADTGARAPAFLGQQLGRLSEGMKAHPNYTTGAAALGLAGLGYGGYRGIKALLSHPDAPQQLSPEEMAMLQAQMMHTASEQVKQAGTFLVAMHNKVASFQPTPVALNAAVGLVEAGNEGLELMAHLVENTKTAEDAEGELAAVLQILQAQGIPPTPELVAALEEELGGGEGGAPEGPPAQEPPKEAADAEVKKNIFKRILDKGVEFKTKHPNVTSGASHGAAAVGGAGVALGASHLLKKKDEKKDEGEKAAAWWDTILKSAEGASLTNVEQNTAASAAKQDEVAALDKKNRPEGKYQTPEGKTQLNTSAGEVGAEKAAAAWQANLNATAVEFGKHLPAAMPIEEKRAHILKIASLPPHERASYVLALR